MYILSVVEFDDGEKLALSPYMTEEILAKHAGMFKDNIYFFAELNTAGI